MEHSEFEQYVTAAIAEVPEHIREQILNVAFVIEDDARAARSTEQEIHEHGTLLGLYQGVPLSKRGAHYSGALPDKITIFKHAIERAAGHNPAKIKHMIRDVVHHEIAHYFGMDEHEVRDLEKRKGRKR